jgi:hypothetical protein
MEWQALATSLAELESHSASHPIERDAPPRERAFPLLLVGALTLFAVAVDGYHPCAEDGGLYLAGVNRLLYPALYPHATAFVLEPMRHSLFAPTVAAAVRLTHLSLPVVLLAFHLASIWLTLFAAWMLASRCWPTRPARAGAVVLLACWLALPIAGTALLFMDPYATARSLSTPAMVLALVGALDMTTIGDPQMRQRGLLLCAASLAFAAAMHPLMAAYALGATLMLLAARAPNRTVRLCATAALATSALALAACLQAVAKPESAATIRVALTRTYWFPAQWRWFELLGLAAPLAILSIFAFRKPGAPSIAYVAMSGQSYVFCLSFRSVAEESAFVLYGCPIHRAFVSRDGWDRAASTHPRVWQSAVSSRTLRPAARSSPVRPRRSPRWHRPPSPPRSRRL